MGGAEEAYTFKFAKLSEDVKKYDQAATVHLYLYVGYESSGQKDSMALNE